MKRLLRSAHKNYKPTMMVLHDLLMLSVAFLAAMAIRLNGVDWAFETELLICLGLTLASSSFIFLRLGLYRTVIRYMGQQALVAVLQGVTASAVVLAVASYLTYAGVPRSVPVIYWCFALIAVGGSRWLVRIYYQMALEIHKTRVAIYGAGTAGLQLYKALVHGAVYKPVAFFDDNASKQKTLIDGVLVYNPANILDVVAERDISEVLLAMPGVPKRRRREITRGLRESGLVVKVIPGLEELVDGAGRSSELPQVYENVLGRAPVEPEKSLIASSISGKVVLVTGAGGSIGSELCRQIAQWRPAHLIMLESSEYALYQIERELCQQLQDEGEPILVTALLGDVRNRARMAEIIESFAVQTIYHAAAYKHVPLVEQNVVLGADNNVLGTLSVLEAAEACGVEQFVLISTDKAVRPTNVMGATKRLAELICQDFGRRFNKTRVCMVRFGNVLGSSGSVIPLFTDQINAGGPVTVTHQKVTRYFMTIPEAAQLVLQAGSMGRNGDVFVLDMGEPVRIYDLARRLIQIMGHTVRDEEHPDGDIEIQITGLRPGEKLYEELLLGDSVSGTDHPMIMRAEEERLGSEELQALVAELKDACKRYDCNRVHQLLQKAVRDYNPRQQLVDVVWARQQDAQPVKKVGEVELLPFSGNR
ncbi:polysaccharide biosynthesis protein [Microbulbifer yueqingensis]|uniref:NDP-sugar epimerase, includes UDP-GlcNAc-inverting 4,6-dehydratase FlaA1 and capsular polysaccharide biosynthesis protein EpsC n=1 Tax=Microbulbifer yueqingensis TaxID=658219 RepID=A0A1G8UGT3_9GAMM|nr:nucleoside-diphosphate sugar epimerase/dehydratase [Microbulbifer yueqingensis]SDJ52844.1 NDP-sugar epimerase, includes UDP-GlcNAc-inverting 4,6-dehydratase FlaA1 and capsular polysaccharide biosynthesis protein EpsC [Microbulbifer yueqingensis]